MKTDRTPWFLVVLLAVGVPGFLQFDRTNLLEDYALINNQSIARIALFCIVGFAVGMYVLRGVKPSRSILGGLSRLLFLYLVFFVTTLAVVPTAQLLLPFYRISEWLLVFLTISLSFRRWEMSSPNDLAWMDGCITAMLLIPPVMVVFGTFLLPEIASFAYPDFGITRLGGYMFEPNRFGLICGVGVTYFWQKRGQFKWVVVSSILFVLMVLTYSRGSVAGFAVATILSSLLFDKSTKKVIFLTGAFLVLGSGLWMGKQTLTLYVLRGQSEVQFSTLAERTHVWRDAVVMIEESPWLGYGFIVGPKQLGDYAQWTKGWYPTHAHNDVMNAMLAGGVAAGFFLLAIWVRFFRLLWTSRMRRSLKQPLSSIAAQLFVYSMLQPVMTFGVQVNGVLFVLLYAHLEITHNLRRSRGTFRNSVFGAHRRLPSPRLPTTSDGLRRV